MESVKVKNTVEYTSLWQVLLKMYFLLNVIEGLEQKSSDSM